MSSSFDPHQKHDPALGGSDGVTSPVDPTLIADGSVDASEFQSLANVTSDIQAQINALALGVAPTYTYTQVVAAGTWTITHNLGKFPSVSVVDDFGNLVLADVNYVSNNEVVVTFPSSFSGKAYLN